MLVSLNAFLLTEVVVGVNGDGDGLGEGDGDAEGAADALTVGVGLATDDVFGQAQAARTANTRQAPIRLISERVPEPSRPAKV
jgi:hypothetical protein